MKFDDMRYPILAALGFVGLVVPLGYYATVLFRTKQSYEKVRISMLNEALTAVPMTSEDVAFAAEVQTTWTAKFNDVNDEIVDALKTVSLDCSVSGYVDLVTYRMPEFSWFHTRQIQLAAIKGMLQGIILPRAMDRNIHVSKDKHLAFVRCNEHLVLLYADEPNGLRHAFYISPMAVRSQAAEAATADDSDDAQDD